MKTPNQGNLDLKSALEMAANILPTSAACEEDAPIPKSTVNEKASSSGKAAKAPKTGKLKKPVAAYVFYLKACAQKWRAMSQGEKEPYERMAEEDMARYEKEMDQRLE